MTWDWYDILNSTLLSCIIIIQIVALFLLKRSKYSSRYKNQVILIIALCIFELTGAALLICYNVCYILSPVLADIILCFTDIFIIFNFYFIMLMLIVDRFLAFFLNFRYQFYFFPSKTIKLVIFVALVCFMISAAVSVLITIQTITWSQLYGSLFVLYLIFDVGYIFLAIGVYSYIFNVYRRQLKFRKNTQVPRKKDRFKLFIPSLIITTFAMFNVIPNIINTSCRYQMDSFDKTVVKVAFILYRFGWLLDPLIYIFFSRPSQNKEKVKKKIRSLSLSDNKESEEMKKTQD